MPPGQTCLTLRAELAENTAAVLCTAFFEANDMVSTLARKLGIALLAISTIAAPVVGAQPRCCKTGALKGSGQCCCGPQAVEETSSCCAAEARPCCASEDEESKPLASPAFADAPCHCKATAQPPAIPSGKHGSELSLEKFVALAASPAVTDDSRQTLIARSHVPVASRGGTSLHKVHCRWTI